MFNPFTALLTAIIAPPAPAIDDTQETPVITLKTRAITVTDFTHGYEALDGHLCQYKHIRDEYHLYTGHIVSVHDGRRGLQITVKPEAGQGVELTKCFGMSEVRLAWYEVEVK